MDHIHPDKDINKIKLENEKLLNQKGQVLWFTGLSGSGKTTIAKALYRELVNRGYLATILDGDNVRTGLCEGLTFSNEDRRENIRRVAHAAKLLSESGLIVLASFISPTESIRSIAKDIIGEGQIKIVFVHTSVAVCEERDSKGLYYKARLGQIEDFTGISSPFETPKKPNFCLDGTRTLKDNLNFLLNKLSFQ